MNYKEVADWLNDNGYKTLRGGKFKNNHTHSIVKKKRLSDDRYTRGYPSQLSNYSIEVVDKTYYIYLKKWEKINETNSKSDCDRGNRKYALDTCDC